MLSDEDREELAAALRQHRAGHKPGTGAAACECGWVGPFTRMLGADMAAHLGDVAAVAVEAIVACHVAAALNEAADELAAFNLESDMRRVPRHVDVPDDYESGVNDAARIVRAAIPKPPTEPDVAARPAGRTPGTT